MDIEKQQVIAQVYSRAYAATLQAGYNGAEGGKKAVREFARMMDGLSPNDGWAEIALRL